MVRKTRNHERGRSQEVIPPLLKGGFNHAGQVCVSVQRIFIPTARVKDFAEQLTSAAAQLIVGPATDEKTEVGPLIHRAEIKRVHQWVHEAVAAGGQLLTGGKTINENYYAPPAKAKVSCQEVFGPVVNIYPYEDVEHAIKQANSLNVAFQAAVFLISLIGSWILSTVSTQRPLW